MASEDRTPSHPGSGLDRGELPFRELAYYRCQECGEFATEPNDSGPAESQHCRLCWQVFILGDDPELESREEPENGFSWPDLPDGL